MRCSRSAEACVKLIEISVEGVAHAHVVLHIPDGWDVFSYHGVWFVKNEAGDFIPLVQRTPKEAHNQIVHAE